MAMEIYDAKSLVVATVLKRGNLPGLFEKTLLEELLID